MCAAGATAGELTGRIVGVSDGDTVTLLVGSSEQVKVRLAEIDAPEKGQPYAQRSKQSLSDLIHGRSVVVDERDRDRYGRTVGIVRMGVLNVNAEQVRRGLAWVYRKYAHNSDLYRLEEEAREARRGLWVDPNPVPPWEWRYNDRLPARELQLVVEDGGPNRCGKKRRCSEMTSCEEARFYLSSCRVRSLDGDGNGVPCERLCR